MTKQLITIVKAPCGNKNQNISLCPVTRATHLGLTEGHTCFLCEQNLIGRPKIHEKNNNAPCNICPKCLQ